MVLKKNIFLGFLCFVISLIFIFDVSYLFSGVWSTYLRGETSAQIDDSKFFYTRPVLAKNPIEIPKGYNYNNFIFSDSLNFVLKKSGSVAFLVIQNDSIRFEKYWGVGSKNSSTNSFSMAKSVVSLLVGCAIDSGFINGVDQSIFDFLPELKPFNGHDVKIKNLLEMSSGLDWLEDYKRPISVTAKSYYGKNLEDLVLGRRFVSVPGGVHKYKSGDTQLLGILLERATGTSVSSFAGEVLWSKIGATNNAYWSLDREGGMEKTFCCFNGSARDFSRLGLLMLNGGSIFGSKIVSSEYVNWLGSETGLIDSDSGKGVDYYANGWWIGKVLGKKIIYARGFNGQYVVAVPELDLVFVRLGFFENEDSDKKNKYKLTDNLKFFSEEVIEAYSF